MEKKKSKRRGEAPRFRKHEDISYVLSLFHIVVALQLGVDADLADISK